MAEREANFVKPVAGKPHGGFCLGERVQGKPRLASTNHKVGHSWLIKCLEERIADPNMLWLIRRLLKSGIMEAGEYHASLEGTPQGGIASPLLANIYLHYVLDLWFTKVIKPEARGMMRLIRYCDDFVVCCESQKDAEEFLVLLHERLKKFNLEVAEEKTKIIKFGRQAWKQWLKGKNKLGSFDFLGFTHYCKTSRNGWFNSGHKTSKVNLRRKLLELTQWLKKVRNQLSLKEIWLVLKAKLLGHYRYFGISGNYRCINKFYYRVISMVFKWINRRSQKKSMNWQKYLNYLDWEPLPKPRIYYQLYATPSNIGNAIPKSPVWENHSQGSVRASIAMKHKSKFKE